MPMHTPILTNTHTHSYTHTPIPTHQYPHPHTNTRTHPQPYPHTNTHAHPYLHTHCHMHPYPYTLHLKSLVNIYFKCCCSQFPTNGVDLHKQLNKKSMKNCSVFLSNKLSGSSHCYCKVLQAEWFITLYVTAKCYKLSGSSHCMLLQSVTSWVVHHTVCYCKVLQFENALQHIKQQQETQCYKLTPSNLMVTA